MKRFRYVPLRDVLSSVALADKLGVSEVARSSRGFLAAYERFGRPAYVENAIDIFSGQKWGDRRDAFISRHLPQYEDNPTTRRRIALLMWAYDPNGSKKKVYI
jgi:hypothetical protein